MGIASWEGCQCSHALFLLSSLVGTLAQELPLADAEELWDLLLQRLLFIADHAICPQSEPLVPALGNHKVL